MMYYEMTFPRTESSLADVQRSQIEKRQQREQAEERQQTERPSNKDVIHALKESLVELQEESTQLERLEKALRITLKHFDSKPV